MVHLTSTASPPQLSNNARATPVPSDRMTLHDATTREPRGEVEERSYDTSLGDGLRLGVATLKVDEAALVVREEATLPLLSGAWDRPTASLQNLREQAVFRKGADLDVLSHASGEHAEQRQDVVVTVGLQGDPQGKIGIVLKLPHEVFDFGVGRGQINLAEAQPIAKSVTLDAPAPPRRMRGLQATDDAGLRRWVFPSDYEKRLADALQRLSRL